jgi:hypothetical protein
MHRAAFLDSCRGHPRPCPPSARRFPAAIFGLADWNSQSECGDVSTFHKAQKYSRALPKQSSTSSPPNSATRTTSLLRAVQTFQPATQVQRLALCPNQGWPKHRPNKLANTRQNPAFTQLSIQWSAAALAALLATDFITSPFLALPTVRFRGKLRKGRSGHRSRSAKCPPLGAQSGHAEISWRCPLLGEQRKTYARMELFRF